ncbi:28362_t:CDS:2 [Dentiscutata erythropus]|uniref:28362_t:CDS:1 n=1 Tax=Dentiscutata erythropus TaxID=1348616 RepID=A0A9N9DSL8_9GLOM|nr:28362_t:CDS:2 [Dentiscutata erythropus]
MSLCSKELSPDRNNSYDSDHSNDYNYDNDYNHDSNYNSEYVNNKEKDQKTAKYKVSKCMYDEFSCRKEGLTSPLWCHLEVSH